MLGYACINLSLKDKSITTNRGMKKATFLEKGLTYASYLALQNLNDLFEILKWNELHGIKIFRMSSDLFPWMSEYSIDELPNSKHIHDVLIRIGEFANLHDMRLSFHPGQFNILCSPREDVVNNTIKELNGHAQILNLMGLECSVKHKVNIHIGGAYGDKTSALNRWIANFNRLELNTRKRITIENDDKKNMYTVEDLMYVYHSTHCPIVFDFHHYDCNPGILSKEESLIKSLSTWPSNIVPMTHFSSSRKIYEDSTTKSVSHADYLHEQIPFMHKYKFHVMIEAKAKELALFKYLNDFK